MCCCRISTSGIASAAQAAAAYEEAGIREVATPQKVDGESVYHLYVVRHADPPAAVQKLAAADIQSRIYYDVPSHKQQAMAPYANGALPATDEAARTHLALPMGPELSRGPGPRRGRRPALMRVWVDLTNSPHVLVMRPLIDAMRADGHEVEVTARDFAQTLQLLERYRMDHTAIGHHRGGRLSAKGVGLAQRSVALARWGRKRKFDVAMGHGSNDVTVAAKLLGIPSATAFDYEWAKVQHTVNCRLVKRVVVPDAIPPERLAPYGATPEKLRQYEGLKEEYYLADFEPDDAVLDRAGHRQGRAAGRRQDPAGRLALPPFRERSVRAAARQAPRNDDRRAPANGRAARRARARGRLHSAREGGRRAESGRLCRLGRLRGRYHEPRSGCPGDPGLHDLRGSSGGR